MKTKIVLILVGSIIAAASATAAQAVPTAKYASNCAQWGEIATDIMLARENGHSARYIHKHYIRSSNETQAQAKAIDHIVATAFRQPRVGFVQAQYPAAADFGVDIENRCLAGAGVD